MIRNLLTNNIPDICHFPGKSYKKKYSKYIFDVMTTKLNNLSIICPKNLGIVSIKSTNQVSTIENQLNHLENFTCLKFTLKDNQLWEHRYKFFVIVEYLKSCPFEYVLHLDAYDVIINNSLLPNVLKLSEITSKIIFNSEKNFYNTLSVNKAIKIKYQFDNLFQNHKYKYLNTGCFLGKKDIILNYFKYLIKHIEDPSSIFYDIKCDQTIIQLDYYLNNNTRELISLDTECKYFMCMNYLKKSDIEII